MKYLVPVIGAVIVALQGVNLHTTGEAAREANETQVAAKTEIAEASEELRGIRKLQEQQAEVLSGLLKNNHDATTLVGRVEAILVDIKKTNAESDAAINARQTEILDRLKEMQAKPQ